MENIPEIYDVARSLFIKLKDVTLKTIEITGYKEYQENILNEFNNFVEAILYKVAVSDNKFKDIELHFVENITGRPSILAGYNKEKISDLSSDQTKLLCDKIDSILSAVPSFVKIAVAADKKIEEYGRVLKPSYTQIVYDRLKRLASYIKLVDGQIVGEEDKASKECLVNVVNYFKSKRISYAPKEHIEED